MSSGLWHYNSYLFPNALVVFANVFRPKHAIWNLEMKEIHH